MPRQPFQARRVRRALSTLPLSRADVAAVGRRSAYIQDILAHHAGDPRWAGLDHRRHDHPRRRPALAGRAPFPARPPRQGPGAVRDVSA
ncbi:hypothetical protein [Nonomuraea sp. NPDC050691]|uniref:hypothetical protein n=1 Tax=Nonomuraea sp. NPDC050691 TaxID=3155661 RepID=UPI00340899A4